MRDLDDFNKLEERAWRLNAELEEKAQKSGQAIDGSAINGIDEQSEKTETDLKKMSMPLMCQLCVTGVLKVNCLVCNVMDYEQ